MENITKTTKFKTSQGASVVVTATLVLQKTHYADGDNITVDCCEMGSVIATIEGHPNQREFSGRFLRPVEHQIGLLVGSIGKLGLIEKNMQKVEAIIDDLQTHPLWVVKQAKIAENEKEIAEMEAARDRNGYCRKCGSYCYGDCEAN